MGRHDRYIEMRETEKRLIDVDDRWAIGTQRDARDTEKDGSQRIDEVASYINRHIDSRR